MESKGKIQVSKVLQVERFRKGVRISNGGPFGQYVRPQDLDALIVALQAMRRKLLG